MPGKILGLDIGRDSISAVQINSALRGSQVTACARAMVEEGGGLEDALNRLFEQEDLQSDVCMASIPGDRFSYRNLEMPFKDPKKIRQTLPFEIESKLPFPIEDLVLDFTVTERSDYTNLLAVSVRKEVVSEYLALLGNHGIVPEILDIKCMPIASCVMGQKETPENGLILDIGEAFTSMVLYYHRRAALIRTFIYNHGPFAGPMDENHGGGGDLCNLIQHTIHAFACQQKLSVSPEKVFFTGMGTMNSNTGDLLSRHFNIPAEQIDLSRDRGIRMVEKVAEVWKPALMDSALALALRDSRHGQGFDLRRGDFEVKKHYLGMKKDLRKIAAFLMVIICFLVADMGTDYYLLKNRYKTLEKKIEEVFRKTLPEVRRIVDPVQQLKVKINEIKKVALPGPGLHSREKVLDLLNDISVRIPASLNLQMTRLVIDQEKVSISGTTDSFNIVDSIKSGLEPSGYFANVAIASANLDRTGKQVKFEIKLQRKNP